MSIAGTSYTKRLTQRAIYSRPFRQPTSRGNRCRLDGVLWIKGGAWRSAKGGIAGLRPKYWPMPRPLTTWRVGSAIATPMPELHDQGDTLIGARVDYIFHKSVPVPVQAEGFDAITVSDMNLRELRAFGDRWRASVAAR